LARALARRLAAPGDSPLEPFHRLRRAAATDSDSEPRAAAAGGAESAPTRRRRRLRNESVIASQRPGRAVARGLPSPLPRATRPCTRLKD
jgi:hypothetical protein